MSLTRVLAAIATIVFVAGIVAPNHYFPWAAYYNEMPVAIAFVPIAVFALHFAKPGSLVFPRHFLLLMAMPLIPVLQWQGGLVHFSGDAWVSSLYLSGAVLACLCGYLLSSSERCGFAMVVDYLSMLLLIGSVLSACIALRQSFGLSGALWEMEIPPGARPVANLAQPNQLSTLLLLGFVALVNLRAARRFGDVCFVFLSLLLILGVAAVQSRSAILVEIALAAWLVWRFPRNVVERGRIVVLVLSVLLIGLLLWFCWPLIYGAWLVDGYVATRSVHDAPRLLLWRQMLEAIRLSPLFGYGWGQVSFAQLSVAAEYPSGFFAESAHNFFLDLLIWNGVPLGGFLVLSTAVWGRNRLVRDQSPASWCAMAMIGMVLVHGMLEYPLHYAYFLLPVAVLVGVVDAEFALKSVRISKPVIGALSLYSLGLLAAVLVEYPSVESGYRNLRLRAMGVVGVTDESVRNDSSRLRALSQMRAFMDFALEPARERMSDEALEKMRIVSRRFPFPPSIFRYTLALALNGNAGAAKKELGLLRNLHGEKHYLEAKEQLVALMNRYPQIADLDLQ